MQQHKVLLIGIGVGLFFTIITQMVFPSTLFLSVSSSYPYLDPVAGIIAYLTIPLSIGAVVGLIDREEAGENGLISGAITGVVNLAITNAYWSLTYFQYLTPQAKTSLNFFALILAVLWAFLAACSAKATAWSLENPSVRPTVEQVPDGK